jgi:hypothetical protein
MTRFDGALGDVAIQSLENLDDRFRAGVACNFAITGILPVLSLANKGKRAEPPADSRMKVSKFNRLR